MSDVLYVSFVPRHLDQISSSSSSSEGGSLSVVLCVIRRKYARQMYVCHITHFYFQENEVRSNNQLPLPLFAPPFPPYLSPSFSLHYDAQV